MGTRGLHTSRQALGTVLALLLATLALAACGAPANQLLASTSAVPALSFPEQKDTYVKEQGSTIEGWEFVPLVDIRVTALGYYDDYGNGLQNTHTVGIFNASSKRLVTPGIVIDGQSPMRGRFRYESITPVVLKAGTSYVVVGDSFAPFDQGVDNPKGRVVAPEIRLVGAVSMRTAVFQFPQGRRPHLWAFANFEFMPVQECLPTPWAAGPYPGSADNA
jgi:hypothetical protein